LGFIGGIVLFVLFLLLLWRVLVSGWRSRDALRDPVRGRLASMILFQLVVNIGDGARRHADHRHPAAVRHPRRASLVSMAAAWDPPEHQRQTDEGGVVTGQAWRREPGRSTAAGSTAAVEPSLVAVPGRDRRCAADPMPGAVRRAPAR
jgi:hypothetical protein